MLCLEVIALIFMTFTSHVCSAKALTQRTGNSRTDTFDAPGKTSLGVEISHDVDGTLYYDPKVLYATIGGATIDAVAVGINAPSTPNLAVLRGNTTFSPPPGSDKCVRLKELYFACTQIGFRPEANLPLSCTMTVEALKAKVEGAADEPVRDASGVPIKEVFFYTPQTEVASIDPLRVTANMTQAVVTLAPAPRYKIVGRSTDTQGLNAIFGLIAGLDLPVLFLLKVAAKLSQLFGAVGDSAVDILADSIAYETGVNCHSVIL